MGKSTDARRVATPGFAEADGDDAGRSPLAEAVGTFIATVRADLTTNQHGCDPRIDGEVFVNALEALERVFFSPVTARAETDEEKR